MAISVEIRTRGEAQETGTATMCVLNISTGEALKISTSMRPPDVILLAICLLTKMRVTPLLMNLERISSKPREDCAAWINEKNVDTYVHTDNVTTDSSTR